MDKKKSDGVIGDLKSIRYQHQKKVFELLSKRDASCKELAKELKISNVSLYGILKNFLEKEIIVATTLETNFGRKPVSYSLNKNYGYFAIFDLTPPTFRFSLYDLRKQNILSREYSFIAPVRLEDIVPFLKEIICQLKESGYFQFIRSVGVSVSGRVNPQTKLFAASATFIDAQKINIQAFFEEYFPCRVYVKNNIALALIDELNTKECEKIKNCIYLYINSAGIGGAVLLNGKIWNGNNHFAGEFSSFLVNETQPLFVKLNAAYAYGKKRLSYTEIIKLYNLGDEKATEIIEEHLAIYKQIIHNALLLLDCDNVIINSNLMQNSEKARATLTKSVQQSLSYFTSPTLIFSASKDNLFIDGCLNYVISKNIMQVVQEEN